MPEFQFIAVLTYGKEKHGDQSDFKVGHGAGADVLLRLFGHRAREFVMPRASYRYVHLDVKGATTHKSYLVLRVTSEEKAQVEAICRKVGSYPWVYWWQAENRRWLEFPCSPQARYIDPSSYGGTYPKFQPTHAAFFTPSNHIQETASAIRLTQSGDWWWIAGDTYPHRDTLKTAGAKWSKSRRAWYYKGRDLPDSIRELAGGPNQNTPTSEVPTLPASTQTDPQTLPVDIPVLPRPLLALPAPAAPVQPDNVAYAIERMKDAPKVTTVVHTAAAKVGATSIMQEYVGELTGSITGNVHCFGYALDQGVCVYLNFGGPRTAVEAIRAKLSKGDIVTCVPWDGAGVELTAGEGNTGKYRDFMQNIAEARYTSVILLHEMLTAPNYGGKSRTYLLRSDEAQGVAMLKHHVMQVVNIPVFDAWADYLWDAGALARLVYRPVRAGGIDLWGIDLDVDAWTRLICGGLAKGVIQLPTV